MKYCVAICLLALTASIKADGGYAGLEGLVYAPGHASADYYAYPKYAFEYAVKDPHTGDNKAQWEKRDGDVVKGAYSLVEPDGSLRVVEYWADDKSGFNAVVKRIGPNLHPTGVQAAPIYKAAIPVLASEHIAPISVGPIAKYEGLLNAPLLSGPAHGYAVSSASLYKDAPILKAPILPEPYIPAPVIDHAPIGPAFKGQIFSGPYLPGPIYKAAPIYSAPLPVLPSPIIKSGPALAGYDGHSGGYDGRLGGYDGPSAGYGGQSAGYGGLAAGYGGRAAGYDGHLGSYGANLGGYGANLGGYGGHSISPLSSGLYKGGAVDLGHELLDNGYGYGKGPLLSGWGGLSAPYNGYKH